MIKVSKGLNSPVRAQWWGSGLTKLLGNGG